jgi:hypothetical protein
VVCNVKNTKIKQVFFNIKLAFAGSFLCRTVR